MARIAYLRMMLVGIAVLTVAGECGAFERILEPFGFGPFGRLVDLSERDIERQLELTGEAERPRTEFDLTAEALDAEEAADARSAATATVAAAQEATAVAERTAIAQEATATAEAEEAAAAATAEAAARATEADAAGGVTEFSIVIGGEEVTYVGPSEVRAGGTLDFSVRVTDEQEQPGQDMIFATLGNDPTSEEATHTSGMLAPDGTADLSLPVNVSAGLTELRVARPPGVVGVIGTIQVLPP